MAAGRSLKTLVSRRRRAGEDDEDDEGPVLVEDSQSEGSLLSEMEDDEDDSSLGGGQPGKAPQNGGKAREQPQTAPIGAKPASKTRKTRKQSGRKQTSEQNGEGSAQQSTVFKATTDTEAMMNGLKIDDPSQDAVDFEASNGSIVASSSPYPIASSNIRTETPAERQRREHEEYKKKRDSNPAFIPNRGNFFMHDTRGHPNGQGPAPTRGPAAGRGRGRGGQQNSGVLPPAGPVLRAEKASEQLWKHDLHDTINETSSSAVPGSSMRDEAESARIFQRSAAQPTPPSSMPISFSSTTVLGRVQLRVFLSTMKDPITYSEVPAKKYVRLPDHRPPLRRDKPVRVFLPSVGPKYIFPATERSFIFIPRQMRPNQRGFGSNYQRSIGGYGYSSRRTSMYGGSVYSGSIAPSRRSSIARDREGMFSPASLTGGFQPPNRPVVRLPHHGGQFFSASTTPAAPLSGQHTPTAHLHTYPLPQQPAFQGTPTTTVQHPRPQKAISVSGIESPAVLGHQQVPSEGQPFHSQLPAHMAEQSVHVQQQQQQQHPTSFNSPHQQYNYPQGPVPQSGTPLSRIPEHAIHAQNFQPPQGMYYPPFGGQGQPYYYPSAPMPMYMMPQQQQGYMLPPPAQLHAPPQSMPNQSAPTERPSETISHGQSQPPPPPPQQQQQQQPQQANSGMVAHESNGMVFYIPASEAAAQSNTNEQYQPAESFVPSYAMPGLPPTPAPDGSGYYYMGVNGMQGMGFFPPVQQGQ